MLKFAPRGLVGRALKTRSAAGSGAVASTEAVMPTQAGEVNVLNDNIWFVNSTTSNARVFGFRWTPGLWARAKVESAETNKAVFQRIKTADITLRDLFHLSGVGLTMWGAFVVGEMVGRWKIFGYRGAEPHHGHGHWTDTPTHH